MQIKPLSENILIKRLKAKDKTSTGVLLTVKDDEIEQGEVITVSQEVKKIKAKDKIIFKNYSLDIIDLDGEELVFIKLENIIAIVK